MKRIILASAIVATFSAHSGLGKMDRSVTQHKTFALQTQFDFACHMNAGSATLIDPYWVITANHVSGSKSEGYENAVTCSSYEKDENGKFNVIHTSRATTDPDGEWGEYEFTDGIYDFALVRLDTPITGIKPAKLPEKGMFNHSEVYEVNSVGFGNYNGRNGGKKFVKYNDTDKKWLAEYKYNPVIMPQSDLQWLIIHGDSGSGITIERDDEFYIIGEIGLQYYGELGWQDTFDDVLGRLDSLNKDMREHGFSYSKPVNLGDVRWTPSTQNSIEDLHAFYSYWKAGSMDFNGTYWTKDGGIYNTAYAQEGETYTFETVILANPKAPAFDVFVNGRQVAHNIKADKESLFFKVNAFEQKGDQMVIEFKPLEQTSEKILLDHFLVRTVE
ncbi:trypsin-like serine peptidase [Vibrio splendidus]|uniref:trypsin-like serine peptidase n=1 Tax=Vibrio splendidus TaxID=29497 RepID=UPI000CBBFEAB|nr:trypsin-like serine protease [Vibrio splendidus]PMH10470.1 hypothetical protein BCU77_08380 [Vibrio splendidus]